MSVYKNMYLQLFNRVTDAMEKLRTGNTDAVYDILKQAQIEAEELYIENAEQDEE